MAAGLLGIGVSSLLTTQQQLATTGHNIANLNTEGYARQRTEVSAALPNFSGGGYVGTGVKVDTTRRFYNEFLEKQIRDSNSELGKYDRFYSLAGQVDNILANPDAGLTPTLEDFYNALQEANDAPASVPARSVLLSSANTLTNRFDLLQNRLIDLNNQVNSDLGDVANEITSRARSISELNHSIAAEIGAGNGNLPNDTLDRRELLIKEIAQLTDINIVYQDNGVANIYIGSGQPLVVGSDSFAMEVRDNEFSSQNKEIFLTGRTGSFKVTEQISGGELQGLLDFKSKILEPSFNALGRIAASVTQEMNDQHALGMTIRDDGTGGFVLGGDFFKDITATQIASSSTNNNGTQTMSVEIHDTRLLTLSDYEVTFDATTTSYSAKRLSDNTIFNGAPGGSQAIAMNSLNAALVGEGIQLNISGVAIGGDQFLVRPTHDLSSKIAVNVSDVQDIALASPISAEEAKDILGVSTNTGSGAIGFVPFENKTVNAPNNGLSDNFPYGLPANIPLTSDILVQYDGTLFAGTGGFNISDGSGALGTVAYNPVTQSGSTLDLTGAGFPNIYFTMSGTPDTGDSFIFKNNSSPTDDNRNGLIMANVQSKKVLQGETADFQRAYGLLVADVGTQTHSAEIDLRAQQTLQEQAKQNRDSLSGVNLDEEASNLLRFQQAYQASSKIISIANQTFDTLLAAVG